MDVNGTGKRPSEDAPRNQDDEASSAEEGESFPKKPPEGAAEADDLPLTFEVTIDASEGIASGTKPVEIAGIVVEIRGNENAPRLMVTKLAETGLIPDWNAAPNHEDMQVGVGCRLMCVNEGEGADRMLAELDKPQKWVMTVMRRPKPRKNRPCKGKRQRMARQQAAAAEWEAATELLGTKAQNDRLDDMLDNCDTEARKHPSGQTGLKAGLTGTVRIFNPDLGWGFIVEDSMGEEEVFLKSKNMIGKIPGWIGSISAGRGHSDKPVRVMFDLAYLEGDKPQAFNAQLIVDNDGRLFSDANGTTYDETSFFNPECPRCRTTVATHLGIDHCPLCKLPMVGHEAALCRGQQPPPGLGYYPAPAYAPSAPQQPPAAAPLPLPPPPMGGPVGGAWAS